MKTKNKLKNKKKFNNQNKNNINKNIREIELSSENIRVVKKEKVTNIKKGKKAATKKAASKKKKNTNPKVTKFIRWTTLLIVIIGITIFICTTPIFNIQEIEVKGNSKLTKTEIISLSKIKKNDNIFKYSKKKISESICTSPYVKLVTIKKKYPDKIQLIIEERQKKACVKVLNSYAYIDEEGYILEISEDRNGLTIIEGIQTEESNIKVGERLIEKDIKQLETALKIVEISKKKEINEEFYIINIQDEEFTMKLETQKKLIYLGDSSNLNYKIEAVKEAIKKLPEKQGSLYVNGNFNNNFEPYFKEGEI